MKAAMRRYAKFISLFFSHFDIPIKFGRLEKRSCARSRDSRFTKSWPRKRRHAARVISFSLRHYVRAIKRSRARIYGRSWRERERKLARISFADAITNGSNQRDRSDKNRQKMWRIERRNTYEETSSSFKDERSRSIVRCTIVFVLNSESCASECRARLHRAKIAAARKYLDSRYKTEGRRKNRESFRENANEQRSAANARRVHRINDPINPVTRFIRSSLTIRPLPLRSFTTSETFIASTRTKHSALSFLCFAFSLSSLLRDYLAGSKDPRGNFPMEKKRETFERVVIDGDTKGLPNARLSEPRFH